MSKYPSVPELEELERLAGGSVGDKDTPPVSIVGVINKLQEMWNYDNCLKYKSTDKSWSLELHTGGWSGNEEIIGILQDTFFWFFHWHKHERGGHYYFGTAAEPHPKTLTPSDESGKAEMERALELACEEIDREKMGMCPNGERYTECDAVGETNWSQCPNCWKQYFISKGGQP